MARACKITGTKTAFGTSHKHKRGSSGGGGVWRYKAQRTNRTWRPNLVEKKIKDLSTGKVEKMKISMKAYKKLRKDGQLNNFALAS